MKNKGFTLVELLAVIVILSVLITIAVPNVIAIAKKIKADMYCDKVKMLVNDAKLYGEDNIDRIKDGEITQVRVVDLINYNYMKKENKKCVVGDITNPCVRDPRTSEMMDNETLTLSIKNKRVVATFNYKNEEDKTSCATN